MSNLPKNRPLRRVARRVRAGLVATALAVTAVVMPSPAYATTYTADACTSNSNTQCILYGTDGSNPQANDVYAKNNNTLDQWKFHSSSVFISSHLGGVLVFQRSKIEYCTGYNHTGSCVHLPAHVAADPYTRLTNTNLTQLLSFAWNL